MAFNKWFFPELVDLFETFEVSWHRPKILNNVEAVALGRPLQKLNVSLLLSIAKPVMICVWSHCPDGTPNCV